MSPRMEPLNGPFGVEVTESDVAEISDEDLKKVLLSLYDNRVAVLKTRGLTKEEFATFSKRVGDPVLLSPGSDDFPEIAVFTNVDEDRAKERRGGRALAFRPILQGGRRLHYDALFRPGSCSGRGNAVQRHGRGLRSAV